MVDQNARRLATGEQNTGNNDPEISWFDRLVLPCLKEPALWPVVFVMLAHAAVFLIPTILFSVRDRKPPAMLAIAVLLVVSFRSCGSDWHRRQFGPISGLLLAIWLFAAAGSYFANRWQLI